MGVSIRIKNPPEGTYWWIGSLQYPFAGSGPLRPYEAWEFPDEEWGAMELTHPIHGPGVGELGAISVYDEALNQLAMVNLLETLVGEGKSYIFDFETWTFEEKGKGMLALLLPLGVVGIVGFGLVAVKNRGRLR